MYKVAFVLMGLGVLGLVIWAVRDFIFNGSIPLLIRIAVGAIGIGALILLSLVLKERMAKAKTDRFKEVER